ncbi:MAG: hypothetical protein Q7R49_01805 [Candidatus Daviesbacteria bacterium]|nr:hypothetical protein [Candidatus Daviesbacteria bacterium]
MLETITGNQVNIGNLNFEEPQVVEPGLTFNPERDITSKDWENMKKSLFRYQTVTDYLTQAAIMKIMFPDRLNELGVGIDRFTKIVGNLVSAKESFSKYKNFYEYAYLVKVIASSLVVFPDHEPFLKREYIEFRDKARKGTLGLIDRFNIYEELSQIASPANRQDFMTDLVVVSRMDLEKYSNLEQEKGWWLQHLNNPTLSLRIEDHAYSAANFKITFPDEHFELSENTRKTCYEYLADIRKNGRYTGLSTVHNRRIDYLDFTNMAYSLSVLSASEIKHTDHGIELVFPDLQEALTVSTPALPEMRKF